MIDASKSGSDAELRRRNIGFLLVGLGVTPCFAGLMLARMVLGGRDGPLAPLSIHQPVFIAAAILTGIGLSLLLAGARLLADHHTPRLMASGPLLFGGAKQASSPTAPLPPTGPAPPMFGAAVTAPAPKAPKLPETLPPRLPRPLVLAFMILSAVTIGGAAAGWADQTQPGHPLFAILAAAGGLGLLAVSQVSAAVLRLSWRGDWAAGSALCYVLGVAFFWFCLGPRPVTFLGPLFMAVVIAGMVTLRMHWAFRPR